MGNYRCLNDNNCNVLYAYELIKPEDIAILKADEIVIVDNQYEVIDNVNSTYDYAFYAFLIVLFVLLIAAFLSKVFTR